MRLALIYGIATGVATGAWMFAEYALGLHDDPNGIGRWTGFLAIAFPIMAAWLLVRRDHKPSWAATAVQGIAFGLAGGTIGGAAIYVYFTLVNPDFAIDGKAADAWTQALSGFVGALVLGMIFVLMMRAAVGSGGQNDRTI